MSDEPQPLPPNALREEAAAWFARMRGDDAELHRAAFENWLARGAMHRAAYNRIGEVFAAGKVLKPSAAPVEPKPRRAALVAVCGCVGALLIGSLVLLDSLPPFGPRPGESHAGMRGPSIASARWILVAPGERALLDVDGVVARNVGADPSVSRLEQGRARFIVSPATQPRTILAGPAVLRTSGGTLDLWLRRDGSVDAHQLSGSALFMRATFDRVPASSATRLLLGAPGRLRITSLGQAAPTGGSQGSDWVRGILEFRATPLADVLEEANRYSSTKIVLADAALGALRVSGRFSITGAQLLARRLAIALSLDAVNGPPGTIVLERKKNLTPG